MIIRSWRLELHTYKPWHVTFDCSNITVMCKCIVGVSKTGYRPKLDDYLSSVDTPLAQDLLSLTNVSKY